MGRWLSQLTENSETMVQNKPPTVVPASPAPSSTVSTVRDAEARGRGWLILASGEAYEQTLARYASIYLLRDDNDTWQVWRGTWRDGEADPYMQKTIAQGVGFAQALARGSNYVTWYRERGKKRRKPQ